MERVLHSRRQVLAGLTAATVASVGHADTATSPVAPPPAFRGQHTPKPLPFDPAKLNGLSERLLISHHDNNYVGAVKNLNRLEQELTQVTKDTPAFVVGGLRQGELTFRNSMVLHEAYFGNLGGDGKISGAIETALSAAYGSVDAWQLHFRATGASLAGGSGWAILGYELTTGELRTTGANHHTQSLAASWPLLVMDMYEHAYALDFGAAAARYVDAYFANIQWDVVNQRLEQAVRIARSLRG